MSLEFLQDAEFAEPTEVRVKRGLAQPVARSTPASLQLGAINKITKARLAWALSELTALNLEKVSQWLEAVAADHPAKAVELLIELAKFNVAQQKSMTVENVPTDTTNYGNLTVKQLQGMVFSQADEPVSEQ